MPLPVSGTGLRPATRPRARRPGAAFTLTEILLALTIIAFLGGLSAPALRGVLNAAKRTACASNLRQAGLAFACYAEDWDGCFPAEGNCGITDPARSPAWFDRLPALLELPRVDAPGSVFQCAAWRPPGQRRFANSCPKSFKMNGYLDNDRRPRHFQPASVRDGSRLVLLLDAVAGETGMGQWGHAVASAVDDSRHPGRANVLHCDLHVEGVLAPEDGDWRDRLPWTSERWERR